jgi:hypothetical protein
MAKKKKKPSAKRELAKQRLKDVEEAERVRELSALATGTPEAGKWKLRAQKARSALAKAAARPSRSTKASWRMGKSPSSGGNW